MVRLALTLIALAATVATALPARAGPPCTGRAEILSHLKGKYHEAPVAMGLANNGGVIEVLASEHGNSWTIIITMPNGQSCLIAAGESWEKLPDLAQARPTT